MNFMKEKTMPEAVIIDAIRHPSQLEALSAV
jgi:hypothetical protein